MTQSSSTHFASPENFAAPALPSGRALRDSQQLAAGQAASQKSSFDRSGTDPALQLISRTAHDLRAPLTTIRESVRLVRDGEFGQLSDLQTEYLSAAIDQCNCVDQMVDEMVHLHSLNSSFPRAQRQWVSVRDIRAAVSDTLKPWVLPRAVDVLWDAAVHPSATVFADVSLLRRLIVNLVVNGVRASAEGEPILIRLTHARSGQSIRWSVVDQGNGISAADMEAIAKQKVPASSSSGLGLMISRQLAALHYSSLWMESRQNTGTVSSFETPAGGPASVVAAWIRWREDNQNRPTDQRNVVKRFVRKRSAEDSITPPRRVRFDVPTLLVELSGDRLPSDPGNQILVGIASLGAATSMESARQFDGLLQRSMSAGELAYRVGNHAWVFLMDSNLGAAMLRRTEIERQAKDKISDLRIGWAEFLEMGGISDSLRLRLSDLLVRKSLESSKRYFIDANEVQLGTMPIGISSVATRRLAHEAHWLRNIFQRSR